jgi:hypothetical protein
MHRPLRLLTLPLGFLLFTSVLGCSSEEPGDDGDTQEDQDKQTEKDDEDDDEPRDAGKSTDSGNKRDTGTAKPDDDDDPPDDKPPTGTVKVDASSGGKDAGTQSSGSDAGQGSAGDAGEGGGSDAGPALNLEKFSFFVTSLKAMQELSKSQQGFGGDLRFGETGENAGLRGADKICSTIAEKSMPGSGAKVWRAFLSTVAGGMGGGPVHAVDRIGAGPWYDRNGKLVGMSKTDLIQVRPAMADPTIKNDLPNEDGVPNHDPDGTGQVDNHDMLTGSNAMGQLYKADVKVTCNDWTKSAADRADAPRVGHSWPRMGFGGFPGGGGGGGGGLSMLENWMSALDEAGCGPGVFLVEMGPPMESNPTVGSGGGYGGIYCFALQP